LTNIYIFFEFLPFFFKINLSFSFSCNILFTKCAKEPARVGTRCAFGQQYINFNCGILGDLYMNKKLVTVAMGVALTLPLAVQAANSGPTVYGKLAAGYQLADNGVVDQFEMVSNASRLGFKGTADLSNGLEGLYQIERSIDMTGESATIGQRNTFVGLKGSFGSVMVGIYDTPLKASQGKADMFNDNGAELFGVAGGDITHVLSLSETRLNNSVTYVSPKLADAVEFRLQIAPGERSDVSATALTASEEDGVANQASMSIVYDANGFYGAIAYDSEVRANAPSNYNIPSADLDPLDTVRITGGVTMGAVSAYAMFEQAEPSDGSADSESGFLLSGSYAIGQTTLKAQLIQSDIYSDGGQQFALGVDQKLAKNTKATAFFNDFSDDDDEESDLFGVGIEHSF
jgi:predicted porin